MGSRALHLLWPASTLPVFNLDRLEHGMSGVLIAPDRLDSSGISSSAAVGVACLLALQRANGLLLSTADNVELDR